MPRGRRANIRVLFGRRLRALRKLQKATQEELGERAGVSGKLVGQIERGSGNPTLEVIASLAAALDVEPSALMWFEEERPGGVDRYRGGGSAVAEKVARYLAERPADDVERALRILEAALGDPQAIK